MAKGGIPMKLKSVLKKLNSSLSRSSSSTLSRQSTISLAGASFHDDTSSSSSSSSGTHHPVFVGKSRRLYHVNADVVHHPLFRELVERSAGGEDHDSTAVSCEVVLFDHLLWMLENGDESAMDGHMADFYACC